MKKKYIILGSLAILLLGICVAAIVIFGKNSDEKSFQEITSLQTSKEHITFQHNGLSEFLDTVGTLNSGETESLNWTAMFFTSDQEVAIAIGHRIIARGKGTTDLYVIYGNFEKVISIEVLSDIDLETLMSDSKSEIVNNKSLTAIEREEIISKASSMYNVSWIPSKTLTSFNNMWTYSISQSYNIPYSQTVNQTDDIEFKEVVNNNDFYDSYSRYLSAYKGRFVMPKYGCDCSGFVSFAWGVKRESSSTFISKIQKGKYPKVGSYDSKNPTYSDLIHSYSSMSSGDAVVRRGHVILIGENRSDFAYCYEQIGLEIELTYWTHSDLAKRGYMPFSRE